jgi:hypothetical protein
METLENLWFPCISLEVSAIRTLTPHSTREASAHYRACPQFQDGFRCGFGGHQEFHVI